MSYKLQRILDLQTLHAAENRQQFHGLFSRTTWISRHQKGYTTVDFNEARDDEVAVASAVLHSYHLHLTPDRQPCQHLITHFLTGWMLFLMPNQQCQSAEGITNEPFVLQSVEKLDTYFRMSMCHAFEHFEYFVIFSDQQKRLSIISLLLLFIFA